MTTSLDVFRRYQKLRKTRPKAAKKLKHRIAEENASLVFAMAARARFEGYGRYELIAAGTIGYMRSIDGFDPDMGVQFSTYACKAIRSEMFRHVRREERQKGTLTSIDAPIRDTDIPISTLLVSNTGNPERGVLIEEALRFALLLPRREYIVLALRFGLFGVPDGSLEYIGMQLGLSKERVRQIEARAIDRLRSWMNGECSSK